MSPRTLFFLFAVLAVAGAFPAESSHEKDESEEKDKLLVRDARFLDRLGVPDSISNRIQSLTNRLSNTDRNTISSLLSTLSDRAPARPEFNFQSLLHQVSSALGN